MKTALFLPALLLTLPLQAQQTSGTVVYDQIISTNFEGENLPEGIAAMIPKEQKFEKVLYFSPDATLYENQNRDEDSKKEEFKQDNMEIHIERNIPDEKTYTDIRNKKVTEQKDLMGRMFLVSRNVEQEKWKFTGRQKKILDLPCMEAVCIKDKDTIVAWYTPGIPVQAGPEHISGLPGLVLEANMGTMVHLVAKRIDEGTEDALKKIKEPSKGKKISAEEFARLRKEKEEEMRKQFGGKGNVIMIQR